MVWHPAVSACAHTDQRQPLGTTLPASSRMCSTTACSRRHALSRRARTSAHRRPSEAPCAHARLRSAPLSLRARRAGGGLLLAGSAVGGGSSGGPSRTRRRSSSSLNTSSAAPVMIACALLTLTTDATWALHTPVRRACGGPVLRGGGRCLRARTATGLRQARAGAWQCQMSRNGAYGTRTELNDSTLNQTLICAGTESDSGNDARASTAKDTSMHLQ